MDGHLVITLFRHGVTEANEKKAYLGWTDSPLSSTGNKRISRIEVDESLIFSSDLKRSTDTAALLFPEKPAFQMRELREIHFGSWEGKTYEELKEDSHYKNWLNDPFKISPPGGEGFHEFAHRIESGWESIKEEVILAGAKQAAIVTHGGVIRYLLMKFAPDEKPFWEWNIPHGTGWEMTFKEGDFRRGRRCILLQEAL